MGKVRARKSRAMDPVQPLLIVSPAANGVTLAGAHPNQPAVPRSERGARRGAAPGPPLLLRMPTPPPSDTQGHGDRVHAVANRGVRHRADHSAR
jgi:hypothetical protein